MNWLTELGYMPYGHGILKHKDDPIYINQQNMTLFFMHTSPVGDVMNHIFAETNFHLIHGDSLLPKLEDPLSEEELFETFGTENYEPLIDDRDPLNASYLQIMSVARGATITKENSLQEILDVFFKHNTIAVANEDFDFDKHEPDTFVRFVLGMDKYSQLTQDMIDEARRKYDF